MKARNRPAQGGARNYEFYILAVLLILVGLLGGSARSDVAGLVVLLPVAISTAFWALTQYSVDELRRYRWLLIGVCMPLLLAALHLLPLPPEIWRGLPGREIIARIDAFNGVPDLWRPLSISPKDSLYSLFFCFVPLSVFLYVLHLGPAFDRKIAAVLAIIIGLGIVVSILQAVGVSIKLYRYNSEMSGIFANRNHQAVLLSVSVLFLPFVYQKARHLDQYRIPLILAAIVYILLIAVLLLINGSRMGLITFVVALVLAPFVDRSILRSGKGHFRKAGGVLIGAAVLAVVTFAVFILFTARDVTFARIVGGLDSSRLDVWQSIVAALPDVMPWGTGVGTYVAGYQAIEPGALLSPSYSNHAHNDWLELVFTTGVPGLVLAVLAISAYSRGWMRELSAGRRADPAKRLGLMCLLVLAIASMTDYPLRTPLIAAVAAIAAAWAARPTGSPVKP
ncbi:O-Antigen ligase family protein [Blastomonas sp. RAC04]|uniref:O-antigen ligase family protein n=1 Tax=Blastomonas sp. RAC04 TaxID=1842535 RepID=UPI00083DF94F|nr:O-antigen ligase family protein [Blastomonas sp. RAC04]AOG00951.1 O-Antigen ligase family protein [Blastomonas sp. RAC04]